MGHSNDGEDCLERDGGEGGGVVGREERVGVANEERTTTARAKAALCDARNFPTESQMAAAMVYIFYFASHTASHALLCSFAQNLPI